MPVDASSQPCGCDPGCGWVCERHLKSVATDQRPMVIKYDPDGRATVAFTVKDSGQRMQFDSGMVRDVATDKTDYTLVLDGPMFKRWAQHLTAGAKKYTKRNWMKANGEAELARFRESALRHFLQWYWGDTDEDHAAAIYFNVNGAEYVKERQR